MKIGRNDPCHCGSGKKYKKCHEAQDEAAEAEARAKAAAARAEEAAAAEAPKDEPEPEHDGVDRTGPVVPRPKTPPPPKGPPIRRRAPGG